MPNLAVSTTSREMFGGAAYVAAGLPGSGVWTDLGLIMRVQMKVELFQQSLGNEIGQVLVDSVFQSVASGMVTLTMRRHNIDQMVALFPHITRKFSAANKNDSYGWNVSPGPVTPIGLHIRPNDAYGSLTPNDGICWWVPGACATDIGEWIYKVENSEESNEDFPLQFKMLRVEQDYASPKQPIHEAGRLLFQGDTTHIVANSWEEGLPFGYIAGIPGAPASIGTKDTTLAENGFTVEWTAVPADLTPEDFPITGYKVLHRVAGSGAAYTTIAVAGAGTLEQAVAGLAASTRYEVLVRAVTAKGDGQAAAYFVTTTAGS